MYESNVFNSLDSQNNETDSDNKKKKNDITRKFYLTYYAGNKVEGKVNNFLINKTEIFVPSGNAWSCENKVNVNMVA